MNDIVMLNTVVESQVVLPCTKRANYIVGVGRTEPLPSCGDVCVCLLFELQIIDYKLFMILPLNMESGAIRAGT